MTNGILVAAGGAVWLGVVTSLSPCPLATNIAAVSVLARRVTNRGRALLGAGAYTLGRASAYVAVSLVLTAGLASAPAVSDFLRTELLPLLGPILILAGMAILGWLPLPFRVQAGGQEAAQRLLKWGVVGEFCLGALFALSFCPVSAALFFLSLMPLALTSSFPAGVVALYGIGTALPVGLLALLLVFSTRLAGKALKQLQKIQSGLTRVTAVVLLGIGLWFTVQYTILPNFPR